MATKDPPWQAPLLAPRHRRLALAALLLIYAVAAFAPFRVDVPQRSPNPVKALPGGGLEVSGIGIARTELPPAWLEELIRTARFELRLRLRTTDTDQPGWVRIATISTSHSRRNLTVGQDGSDLVVHVRTSESDRNGHPPLRVEGVFAQPGPVDVSLVADGQSLRVSIDGELRASRELPSGSFRGWDPLYRLALGNEIDPNREEAMQVCRRFGLDCAPYLDGMVARDDHAWRGVIDEATMRVGSHETDYAVPGALRIPTRLWVFGDDPKVSLVPWWGGVLDNVVNFLGFVPLGYLLALGAFGASRRRRWLLVASIALSVSLSIELTQLLLPERTTSVTDLMTNLAGALLGAALATRAHR